MPEVLNVSATRGADSRGRRNDGIALPSTGGHGRPGIGWSIDGNLRMHSVRMTADSNGVVAMTSAAREGDSRRRNPDRIETLFFIVESDAIDDLCGERGRHKQQQSD